MDMHYLQIFQEALWVLRAFIHLRGGWGDSFIFRGGMKNPGWHWSLWNGNVINLFFKRWPSIIKLFYEGNYCVNLLLHWFIKTYFQQWWQESYFVSKSQDDLYVQSYSCWSHKHQPYPDNAMNRNMSPVVTSRSLCSGTDSLLRLYALLIPDL